MTPVPTLSGSLRDADIHSQPNGLEFYRAQYDATGQIVDFRLATLNASAIGKWGRAESELLGQSVNQLMCADDANYLSDQFRLVVKSGRAVRFDMSYLNPCDGASRSYELLITKQDDGVLVNYNVLTGRKDQSADLLESIQHSSQHAMAAYKAIRNAAGEIIDFKPFFRNRAAAELSGQSLDVNEATLLEFMPALKELELFKSYMRVVETGISEQSEEYYKKGSVEGWYNLTLEPWGDGFIAHVIDTTALRKAEQEKLKQSALLETIIDNIRSGIVLYEIVHDELSGGVIDFRYVLTNPANEQVINRSKTDLLGKSVFEMYPGLMQTIWGENLFACARTGERQEFMFNYFDEGINGWFDISFVRHEQYIFFTFSDVTSLKETELALQQQNDLLKEIVENGQTGMTLFDPVRNDAGEIIDFQYVFTNAVNARVMGRSIDELTGERLLTLFPARPQTEWYANLMHTATTGESRSYLYELHTETINGWFNTLFVKVGDQILYTYLDITSLKQAKRALERQNHLLEQVMNTTPTVIALHESVRDEAGELIDFHLTHLNQKAADLLGHSLDEGRIPLLSDYFPGVQKTPVFEHYRRVVQQGELIRTEVFWKRHWYDLSAARIGDGMVVVAQDITPMKESQHNLEVANLELKRSNENLQSFAFVSSHDLQEPLRKIISFANIIQTQLAGQVEASALDMIERISTSADRMRLLIQDLLAYSKLETNQELFKPVNLSRLLAELKEHELWVALNQSNAQLHHHGLPTLIADPLQMRQLFQNLLSNALKFCPKGVTPVITVSHRLVNRAEIPADLLSPAKVGSGKTANTKFYEIAVTDNGIGFEEKYIDRIFQVFQRLHGRSQYTGSGIGLAICYKIVERHGGAITASSKPGEGSTFRVYLPA